MLNGTLANRQAKALSQRLARDAGKSHRKQIDLAYELVAGRAPKPTELQLALKFLDANSKALGEDPAREQFALAMFNLNAFLYVN